MKHYEYKFYDFLVQKAQESGLELSEDDIFYLYTDYIYAEQSLRKIVEFIINKFGFEGLAKIIKEYNKNVVETYQTNEEI